MNTVTQKLTVPTKFQPITKLQSIEIRSQLLRIISSLDEILNETKGIILEDKTKSLLQRFYEYLDETCQSQSKLNRRSLWLMTYGTVVLSRMETERNKIVKFSEEYVNHEHNELMDKMSLLVLEIGKLQTVTNDLEADNCELISLNLEHLIGLAQFVKPQMGSPYYKIMFSELDRLITIYHGMNNGKIAMISRDFTTLIFNDISKLCSKIRSYHVRKRFIA